MNFRERASIGLLDTLSLGEHRVRVYDNRLAIWRTDGGRLTWDELQQVKQEVWGDRAAIEVYPAQCEVVNLRNTRHLWSSDRLTEAVMTECRHPEFYSVGRGR